MSRLISVLALTVGMILLCGTLATPATAGNYRKPYNPYSSFNIHGLNYGAQQWARTHGQAPTVHYRHRLFRR